jgi:2-methylcitrate dehydratase PrpD
MTAAERLADWAVALQTDEVPRVVRDAVCRHLLDGLGVGLAAARTGAAKPGLIVAQGLGGPPEARPLAGGPRIGAPAAALAGGALVHALDFDDTHAEGLVHPTAVVLPTAFAVGQQTTSAGDDVLAAALVGYEIICRLGCGAPHGFHAQGLHATSVCGPLAAAATTARLLRLTRDQTVNALGIAGSSAGGLLEFLGAGTSTKSLHPGLASMAGIIAARLAAAGAEGPNTVVEGERGLYAALSARSADPTRVTKALGEEWEVMRIDIKPYPACQLMHAALVGGGILRERLAADDIATLEVRLHPDSIAIVAEPIEHKRTPSSPYDAKFSLPWSLAALLIDGSLTVDSYSDTELRRRDIKALAARVLVRDAPAEGPAALAGACLVATTLAGDSVEVVTPSVPESRQPALNDDALVEKLRANVGDSGVGDALATLALDLSGQPSLDPIIDVCESLTSTPSARRLRRAG